MSIGKKSKSEVNRSRPIVYKRDGHECVISGSLWAIIQRCGSGMGVQHRVGKGAGGSNLFDTPAHLVTMCNNHNRLVEDVAEFKNYCERNGISIRRHYATQHLISRIPIRYVNGWFLLDGGNRFEISETTANVLMQEIYGDSLNTKSF